MKENKFTQSSGIIVFDGNELLIKGALEAGVALITGYPGSPVANVFDVIETEQELFREKGIKGIIANNENQSAALLHGAMSVPGIYAMTIFKSVGTYVALDGLAITNYAIPEAGSASLCVAGDDPALSSTQVGADSRYTFFSAKIPVIEPSTNQEIKDWIKISFELARDSQLLVGYIITTNQADGGGTVRVFENVYPKINMHEKIDVKTSTINLHSRVSVPPHSLQLEKDIIQRRMPLFLEAVRNMKLNTIHSGENREYGFITSGNSFNYLQHAFLEMNLSRAFPILKLGCTYPIDPEIIIQFASNIDEIIIVEEKRGFIESQVKEILRDRQQTSGYKFMNVWGKNFPSPHKGIPEEGGLTPSILIDRIGRLLLSKHS